MNKLTSIITHTRDSKRTYQFAEVDEDGDALPAQAGSTVVGLILSKKAVGGVAPERLRVTIEEDPTSFKTN